MEKVKAKKHLGQHFLKDESIAKAIADTLTFKGYDEVLEIGPGMGVLTKYLLEKPINTHVIEIDTESVAYLDANYPKLKDKIISQDVFRTLELRDQIPEFSGMFQKEVAERICEKKGSKTYGILSVLAQAFYDTEYLFTVNENVFIPPPKVKSGVMRMTRKEDYSLPCSEKLFFTVVKTAFQQRRKTLRNSLKTLNLSDNLREDTIFDKRPEQLSVDEFIELTLKIEANGVQS
jgi:16S rRNA (adenine1518-N6/adenine1519-N6)-dimethyltransferase